MKKEALKYIRNIDKISMGDFISDLSFKYDIPLYHCLTIFNALKTNRRLTIIILESTGEDDKSIELESLYLQLLKIYPDICNFASLKSKLNTILKLPNDIGNYNMAEFVNFRNTIEKLDYDLSREQINNIMLSWGDEALKILKRFNNAGLLYNDKFTQCTKEQARAIMNNLTYLETSFTRAYDFIDLNSHGYSFDNNLAHVKNIVKLYNILEYYYHDKKEDIEVYLKAYGDNPLVLNNLVNVLNIRKKYPTDKQNQARELSKLFKTKFTTILAKYTVAESCTAKNKLKQYCFKYNDPVAVARNFGAATEKIAEEFPFLKTTIERIRKLSLEVYDEVLEKISEDKVKIAEEAKKKKEMEVRKEIEAMLPTVSEVIESYISSYLEDNPISARKYCINNDIDKKTFDKYIKIAKEYLPELHALYRECSKKSSVRMLNVMTNVLKEVIDKLKENPDLSLYDYYTMTKFDPATLCALTFNRISGGRFDKEERELFRDFYKNKVKNIMEFDPGYFYNDSYTIKDKELTNEDKKAILDYMSRNKLPFKIPLFKAVARQYMDGTLEENKQERGEKKE